MASNFANGASGVRGEDGQDAEPGLGKAVVGVLLPAAALEDREPGFLIPDNMVAVIDQTASHLVTGLPVDNVDPARGRKSEHGENKNELAGQCQDPQNGSPWTGRVCQGMPTESLGLWN